MQSKGLFDLEDFHKNLGGLEIDFPYVDCLIHRIISYKSFS